MTKQRIYVFLIPLYVLILCGVIVFAFGYDMFVSVSTENALIHNRRCVVIDAGHGGVDGGAVSCTGVYESAFNLQIAIRLNDLMHLLGMDTQMIRTKDISVYTEGNTISAKKISDLKQRVRMINSTENAILISIHQNNFSEERYSGAQVFYSNNALSKEFAHSMQSALAAYLNPDNHRKIKKADGVYLMQHIECPGILVECGFLSNYEEEAKLRTDTYQIKLCCVIAAVTSQMLQREDVA